jgi:predicted nucleotidyltransferase
MTRDQATAKIESSADALRARGVEAVYLLGPTSRGRAGSDSGFGIYIDVSPKSKFSLLDLAGVHRLLSKTIGQKVEVITRDNLHPKVRMDIERDAVRVF